MKIKPGSLNHRITNLTSGQIERAIAETKDKTILETCEYLGLPKSRACAARLSLRIRNDPTIPNHPKMHHQNNELDGGFSTKWSDEDFYQAWNESITYKEVAEKLSSKYNLSYRSAYREVKRLQNLLNLSNDHMVNGRINTVIPQTPHYKNTLEEILVENSNYSIYILKKRLVASNTLEYRCSWCGNEGEWLGKELTLHLDHINGINNDNRIENLRFLCPMCHSQTHTFRGRNRNAPSGPPITAVPFDINAPSVNLLVHEKCVKCNKQTKNGMLVCVECASVMIENYDNEIRLKNHKSSLKENKKSENNAGTHENHKPSSTKRSPAVQNFCVDCNAKIHKKATRCKNCHSIFNRRNIPSKEVLIEAIRKESANLTQVGKQFNVSCNSIRKWCRSYDLPTSAQALKGLFIND